MKRYFSLALVLLLLLGTLRGGATSISKYVSINEIPPLAYSMWQSLIVALLMLSMGYASMSVFISRHPLTGYHLFLMVGGSHLVTVLFLLPITVASGNFVPLWEDPGLVEALIVCHGFIAAAAYSMFFKIVELEGPVFYSFSTYIIAITGILWGWVIFSESHPAHFWLAVALIFSGLAITNYRRREKPATSEA